jgi:hypothetical protein
MLKKKKWRVGKQQQLGEVVFGTGDHRRGTKEKSG